MQKLQLYINDVRVDLFDDESVVLTQTIQNVKELDKVFTDFTKTFSLPSSKENNKLFKHYYNFDIVNGFDARKKVDARIELNNIPFRVGKLKLEGVNLKNNVPNSYRVTFFGNTVTLKELFGEDKLNSLTSLTSFNKAYSANNVRTDLQLDSTANDFLVPLISNSRRFYYDSATTDLIDFSSGDADPKGGGNLDYVFGRYQGVYYKDLKYALRVHSIIQAIETKYNITFSNDFFNSSNAPYYQLFLWLHRKKEYVESLDDNISSIVDGWVGVLPPDPPNDTLTYMSSNQVLKVNGTPSSYNSYSLTLTTSSPNAYRALIFHNGDLVFRSLETTGNLIIDENDFTIEQGEYTVYIEGGLSVSFTQIQWDIEYNGLTDNYPTGSYTYNAIFTFDIPQQIPEIKVIDFVSGLFKMFNLTAYLESDEIVVKTLDSYYSGGTSYDITEYVDIDKSSVDVALPYREITFVYKGLETFLVKDHEQRFAKKWGKIEYDGGEVLDGGTFKIELPFSQMKYERLVDANNPSPPTSIMYGWMVDDSEDATVDEPLLFYPVTNSGTQISFVNSSSSNTGVSNYNIPSNSLAIIRGGDLTNINFFNEINEYALSNGFTDTLFEVYYKNYIQDIFNAKNRLTKVTAYLPLKILLNYNLSDRFIIKGNKYKINSIKTNLITGKSELELLNEI